MARSPIMEHAAQMRADAARYQPEDMHEYMRHISGLEQAFIDIAESIRIMAAKAQQELPVHPKVTEHIGNMWQVLAKVPPLAAEPARALRAVHEVELRRLEQPRTNEHLWNTNSRRIG